MDRCVKCMEPVPKSGKCKKCGYKNKDAAPKKMKQLTPSIILKKRYLVGLSVNNDSIFTTYTAFDLKSKKKIYIQEFLPDEIAKRNIRTQKITAPKGDSAKKFDKAKRIIYNEATELKDLRLRRIDILAVFEENNTVYIVRERCANCVTLTEFIRRSRKIPRSYAKHIMISLIKIVNIIHKQGIVCGNIQTDNITIDEIGNVRLTNIGFYGSLSEILPVPANTGYSPLEQYTEGNKLTERTDVYSVAAVYYALIVREKPVSARYRRNSDILVPPSRHGIAIQRNVENAMLNALNINPMNRTANLKLFLKELKDPETKRKWERVKGKKKMDCSFLMSKAFWKKFAVYIIIFVMVISLVGLIKETISVQNRVEEFSNSRKTEISTMAVPKKTGKSDNKKNKNNDKKVQ